MARGVDKIIPTIHVMAITIFAALLVSLVSLGKTIAVSRSYVIADMLITLAMRIEPENVDILFNFI